MRKKVFSLSVSLCREEWTGPEDYRCLSMDYLLLGVYASALVLGILGPVLVLCLYRNLRGCTRYRQVPWSSASSDLSSSSASTGT
jgi:hypothetical protein